MCSTSRRFSIFFLFLAILSYSVGTKENNGDPKKSTSKDGKTIKKTETKTSETQTESSQVDVTTTLGGQAPAKLTLEEFQQLHSYSDFEKATTDNFPKPEDAQEKAQKSDLTGDLGKSYDKDLMDKLTKGKKFNPLFETGE